MSLLGSKRFYICYEQFYIQGKYVISEIHASLVIYLSLESFNLKRS